MKSPRGLLIAEGVVAAFLMLFAFLAASSLFDASLRWEAEGIKVRQAALIAERRMEELRSWAADSGGATSFPTDAEWTAELARITQYPDTAGFRIEATAHLPRYPMIPNSSGLVPEAGLHSPNSMLFTLPPGPAPSFPNPHRDSFLDNDPQRNFRYKSHPYSRNFPRSSKMVQVRVSFGSPERPNEVAVVSLITDHPRSGTPVVEVFGGSNSLSRGQISKYQVRVRVGGALVEDVVTKWGTPLETSQGDARLRPSDSSGTAVNVMRAATDPSSGTYKLQASILYRGQTFVGEKEINFP